MLYNYNECMKIYGNDYNLKKALENNEIFKIEQGIYSTCKTPKQLELFIKKHDQYIFTLESALYYLGICDEIPNFYSIATNRNQTKYKDKNIKQYYFSDSYLNIGKIKYNYQGTIINIYNKERLLIETVRYKNKLPFDYYKQIINYYRNNIYELDFNMLKDYIFHMPKGEKIFNIIQAEVL